MRETLGGSGQGDVVIANGVRYGESEMPDCEQMSGAQVMAALGRINVAYAGTGLLWGDPNPIQEVYLRLNKRVQKDNLWGDPKDTAFSPIAAALTAIKE